MLYFASFAWENTVCVSPKAPFTPKCFYGPKHHNSKHPKYHVFSGGCSHTSAQMPAAQT